MILCRAEYKTLIHYNDSFYYFKRQLLWSLLGLVAMFIMINYDYRRLQRYIIPFLAISFVLLVLVLIPGIGGS